MNKLEIVKVVAEESGLTQKEVGGVLDSVIARKFHNFLTSASFLAPFSNQDSWFLSFLVYQSSWFGPLNFIRLETRYFFLL